MIDWEREQDVLRLLHRHRYITADQAREVYQEGISSDRSALGVAVHKGYVTQEQIDEVRGGPAEQVASLREVEIDPGVLDLIPREMGRRLRVFPVCIRGDTLELAMSDPDNVAAIDEVRRHTALTVKALRVSDPEIAWAMDTYWTEDEVMDLDTRVAGQVEGLSEEVDRIADLSDAPAIVQLASSMITEGVRRGASDVHVESLRDSVCVRFRVDGVVEPGLNLSDTVRAALLNRLKIMSGMDIAESRQPQDGRFTTQAAGRRVDVRVACRPTLHGENIVLRLLDKTRLYVTFDQLGMSGPLREGLEAILSATRGLVAVAGGTGSGKTTTLYAAVHYLRREQVNIETVEDPIEYQLEGVNQSTARPDIGVGFAEHVKAIMRQDPDIIMVGEARDHETMDASFRAALTGHLVLTSMHGNDAPGALTRMLQMGVEPYLVSSALRAVMGQRLVRKVCPECKVMREVSEVIAETPALARRLQEHRIEQVAQGEGCERCRGSGYLGRTGIFELMRMTPRLKQMVLGEIDESEVRHTAVSEGMVPMASDVMGKLRAGTIGVEGLLSLYADQAVEYGGESRSMLGGPGGMPQE
jgi:type IV pilus assembly protein PilB